MAVTTGWIVTAANIHQGHLFGTERFDAQGQFIAWPGKGHTSGQTRTPQRIFLTDAAIGLNGWCLGKLSGDKSIGRGQRLKTTQQCNLLPAVNSLATFDQGQQFQQLR